jgi:hypothetical protein
MHRVLRFLATALGVGCCILSSSCGGTDPVGTVQGEYTLIGPSFCNLTREGAPNETFAIVGDMRVGEPFTSSPQECEATITVTQSGEFGERCQLCMQGVQQVGTRIQAELGRAYADGTFASCSFLDERGGASSDLLFGGSEVLGQVTYDSVARSVTIEVRVDGTSRLGLSGSPLPSVATCTINATRAE